MSTVTATSAAIVPEFDWESLLANIITEDDEPVDNMPSAAQQRLLVTPLGGFVRGGLTVGRDGVAFVLALTRSERFLYQPPGRLVVDPARHRS